jgi:hypothetical protein
MRLKMKSMGLNVCVNLFRHSTTGSPTDIQP